MVFLSDLIVVGLVTVDEQLFEPLGEVVDAQSELERHQHLDGGDHEALPDGKEQNSIVDGQAEVNGGGYKIKR